MVKGRLFVTLCIVLCFMYVFRNYILDDGLIYARYVENALHGNGLVFNAGESVNALTSPLFTYLLLFLSWILHGHVILAEQILFSTLFLCALILAERLVPYSSPALAVTAYFYFLIGMESTLFLFLLTLATTLYVNRQVNWIPLLLALVVLTRFEGGLLIPIIGWRLWQERTLPKLWAYIAPVAVLLAYTFLNHLWYGAFLPSSTTAKLQQGLSGYWGKWPTAFLRVHVWAFGRHGVFTWTAYIIPIVAVLTYVGWKQLRDNRMTKVLAPFSMSLLAFYVLFNIPDYHWYYAPFIFFAIMYAVQAVPKRGAALGAMIAILAIECITNVFVMEDLGPNKNYVQMSFWIREHTPATSRIASCEIGQIGWYSDRNVIDIMGLTNPKNSSHIAHRDTVSWLNEDNADYIIVHDPAWPWEEGAVRSTDYAVTDTRFGDVYLLKKTKKPIKSSEIKESMAGGS